MNNKIVIKRLKTQIPGLDNLLGGGIPEFSFNLIAGPPGSGKTSLAHQIMFALANPDCRAIFFTVLGEPPLKMLRYQQQYDFYDIAKVDSSIHYINLSEDLIKGHFSQLLSRISTEIEAFQPKLVFVDSFRSVQEVMPTEQSELTLQQFVQQLGIFLTSWQATTFLIGEYVQPASELSPIFTIADGILWLTQNLYHNSMVRKIQVVKMRGQAPSPGLHSFRISEQGIHVFTRAIVSTDTEHKQSTSDSVKENRLSLGIPALDDMLGGGVPAGYSLLVVGPSGSGKTILATEFLAAGVAEGEPGVIAAFEKSPSQLLNSKLNSLIKAQQVGVLDTHGLDLAIDQILYDLLELIDSMQAKRVVIDSLSGFELAVASEFNANFRSSLYRMIAELTNKGLTVLMTSELEDRYTDLRFSPFGNAFLADAIIMQRYIEIKGQFNRVLSVVKIRGSTHSKDIRLFTISDEGIELGETLGEYTGIMTGHPVENHSSTGIEEKK
jgi:circadian clock protein KaiC